MKTTLNIHDNLLFEAKAFAVQQRTTLTRLIEEGLRLRLQPKPHLVQVKVAPIKLKVMNLKGGMQLGIDPCSNQSMYDAADRAGNA